MSRPLCFVLMPFGTKRDPAGGPDIAFDRIYELAIEPAISDAGLDPIRADHERTAGIIHKAMFERLLLCEFAVADLTTANANVFYELGVRHTARPQTTLTIFASQQPIPFDVNLLRAVPYRLGEKNAFGELEAAELRATLTKRLKEVRELAYQQQASDSPIVQLLQGYHFPDIAHLRTDVFREQIDYAESLRRELREARRMKPVGVAEHALASIEQRLSPFDSVETGVLVDLLLSYRAVGAFDRIIDLFERFPEVLKRTVLVREQLAFALNRKAGKQANSADCDALRDRAVRLLREVIEERGPNAETCGLLGRIHKDRWDEARKSEPVRAKGLLRLAIREYVRGFESDWRDAYPGVNAVTLLDIEGSPGSLAERDRLLGVVRYAVEQRLCGSQPDYWDHATLLELSVLANKNERAATHLEDALASVREYWEPETTARNLNLIAEARAQRGTDTAWISELTAQLDAAARELKGAAGTS